MQNCSKCLYTNPDHAKFCQSCGSPLGVSGTPVVPARAQTDWLWCMNCFSRVGEDHFMKTGHQMIYTRGVMYFWIIGIFFALIVLVITASILFRPY